MRTPHRRAAQVGAVQPSQQRLELRTVRHARQRRLGLQEDVQAPQRCLFDRQTLVRQSIRCESSSFNPTTA